MSRPLAVGSLLLILALLSACGAAGSAPAAPTATLSAGGPPRGEPILTYQEEGGIAGFCDTLTVAIDAARYESCKGPVAERPTTESERARLAEAYSRFKPFTITSEDNPGGPDSLKRRLTLAGVGAAEATEDEQAALLDVVTLILRDMRQAAQSAGAPPPAVSPTAPTAAPTPNAAAALARYRDVVAGQSGPDSAAQEAFEEGLDAALPALGGPAALTRPQTLTALQAALGPGNSPAGGPMLMAADADGDGTKDLLVAPGVLALRPVALLSRGERAVVAPLLSAEAVSTDVGGAATLDRVADINRDGTPEVVIPFELPGASALNTELFVVRWDGQRFGPVFRTFLTTWAGGGEWTIRDDGTIETTCAVLGAFDHKLLPHPFQTNVYDWAAGSGYALVKTRVDPPASQRQQANLAEAAFRAGNWQAAIERYQRLIDDSSLQVEPTVAVDFVPFAHLRLGQLFALTGQYDAALAELRLAGQAEPFIGDLALAFREGYAPEGNVAAGWANMLKVPLYRAIYEEQAGNLGQPAEATAVLWPGAGLAAFLNVPSEALAMTDAGLTTALASSGLPVVKAAIDNLDTDPAAPEVVVEMAVEGPEALFGPEGRQYQVWLLDQGPQGPGWWPTLLSAGETRLEGIDRPTGAEAGEVVLRLPAGSDPAELRIRWTGERALRVSPDGSVVPLDEMPGLCRPG
ncbi:MAG: tetratricopeptide repeat protein [Ardenticatenaceae bacterium]|nr:tetratricopeptide repeat protein [Ardenticatenaceae bacterium]